MPFRERAKKLFKSKNRGSDSDSLSKSSSKNSSRDRWPSNVYKPGEPMPRPKYRKPPTKEHKEHLESFSFAEAWRRKSFQSQYSPMGTRLPSRRNSFLSMGSRKRSYLSSRGPSRNGSVGSQSSDVTEKSMLSPAARQRERGFGGTRLSTEVEAEGDDDIHNVGLSRVQSRDHQYTKSKPKTTDEIPPPIIPPMSTAHDHQPFSEQDLALAMQRSHLAVPTQ
ncbi:hypothetical protein EJ03DRAFT_96799 [Teratosphaeria nubilosa]|uniref:Uncharacterized protein n=1 Tax=Teratosphaeria nubilosa TaxID=161662 RepID=A0A6G1L993_9PEZI|nr:hypothetical protein EJ03DRAFT_96799 [Teratosphaeria nubilosa]